MIKRRKFIKKAGLLALAPIVLGPLAGCKEQGMKSTVAEAMKKGFTLDEFGIQLWTVRDAMAKDPKATLKQLGTFGYKQIESFQGEKGVFWGMKPKEYADFLADNGMRTLSAHCNSDFALNEKLTNEFKQLADDAASIDMKYLVNPFLGSLKTLDDFKRATEGFNKCGEICKERGLKYNYHNHSYSFREIDGMLPQDVMMSQSDPDLVGFEMDIYWVVAAGQDPITWLKKYDGRWTLSHVKDRYKPAKIEEIKKEEGEDEMFGVSASCVLGEGQIDFPKILEVCKEVGMKEYFVEQERYDGMTSMEAAQKDAEYMKSFEV